VGGEFSANHQHQAIKYKTSVFPSKCDGLLQLLNQRIIRCFKVHYRKFLLRRLLSLVEDSIEIDELIKGISILDALYWIKDAWNSIFRETIRNCFRKAKFLQENQDSSMVLSDGRSISNVENELVYTIGQKNLDTPILENFH
jgi:hypothetical protein